MIDYYDPMAGQDSAPDQAPTGAPDPSQNNQFWNYLQNFMKPGGAGGAGNAQSGAAASKYQPSQNITNKSAQSAALQAGMSSAGGGLCGSGGGAAAGGL